MKKIKAGINIPGWGGGDLELITSFPVNVSSETPIVDKIKWNKTIRYIGIYKSENGKPMVEELLNLSK